MLQCSQLSLVYRDGSNENRVLSNVNLKVEKGENVVLLGPSGSGKSSLIYLLSGLKKPASGSVLYEGKDLGKYNDEQASKIRKSRFGFIFQMHFLIPYLTVMENVLTGAPEFSAANCEKGMAILKELGIGQYAEKKMHLLSGGERQRVAIARALVASPDVIFADEPTASLDHENAVEIIKMLKDYRENSTLIMATHDTSILNGDERVLRIANHNVFDQSRSLDQSACTFEPGA